MIHVNNAKLKELLHKRLKITATQMKMHYGTFYNRINDGGKWTVDDLNQLEKTTGIPVVEFVSIERR